MTLWATRRLALLYSTDHTDIYLYCK